MDETIIKIILLLIIGAVIWYYAFPYVRGPAADISIKTKIDTTGNISAYSIEMQFPDDMSYSSFLSNMKGANMSAYELRATSRPNSFVLTNDSANKKITINAIGPFDPNSTTSFMRLTKTQDYWEFEDTSVNSSSFLPENYINKLTYSLTIPSDILDTTTLDNSSVLFSKEKQLTWTMDQDKNWFNPKGDNYNPPRIYAKFQVPEPANFPWVPIGIGAIVAVIIGLFILQRRRC